jgi:hypothetical protein
VEHGHPARQSAHQTVMAVTADLVDPLVACISRIKSLRDHRDRWTGLLLGACALFALPAVAAQSAAPQIVAVTPRNGAEGTRVEVRGKNFQDVSAVLFAATNATFQIISPASLVAIVPHRVGTSRITVITKEGRAQSPVTFIVENDPRIPDEVSYKAGYVNPHGPPEGFTSARLWGIAIADTRAPENKSAQIEVAWTRLSCRIDGRQVVLNDDVGQQFTEQFDVVVVGAGHAGCEAAMAAARMGLKTALYTLNVDLIAQMSCNPAIGGIAKGHLVREVDALGGIMGEITDAVGIQFRLLNTSRGPAVWSPRAQCDKQAYRLKMREVLESQPNLKIKQAEVADLIVEARLALVGVSDVGSTMRNCLAKIQGPATPNDRRASLGIKLRDGRTVGAAAVIITTGTFLNGLIHCGEQQYPAGRSGEPNAVLLGEALKKLGLRGCRLKTGTPPRLDGRTIDWSRFRSSPATPIPRRSVFAPSASRITIRRSPATSPGPRRRRTASSAKTFIARRCTAGRSSPSGRAIALRSKTRSSSFPTRPRTSSSSSPKA